MAGPCAGARCTTRREQNVRGGNCFLSIREIFFRENRPAEGPKRSRDIGLPPSPAKACPSEPASTLLKYQVRCVVGSLARGDREPKRVQVKTLKKRLASTQQNRRHREMKGVNQSRFQVLPHG